jgi:hypothetical protein
MTAPIRFHKTRRARAANVYRLLGRNEDALTYALGHLMAIDDVFMIDVLKRVGVLQRIPGRQYKNYRRNYAIHLQELREVGPSGRRDIVIEAGGLNGLRVVVEAKIGKGQPTVCQLMRYTIGCDCPGHSGETRERIDQAWQSSNAKFIVALTRDALERRVQLDVQSKLNGSGITLLPLQWHQILEVALNRREQLPVNSPQLLFVSEFIDFFREHYDMKYYDAEVLIADVDAWNARIFLEGHMYAGGMRRSAPLYFAPYFTRGNREAGLSYIGRVLHVEQIDHFDEVLERQIFDSLGARLSLKNLGERWTIWQIALREIFKRARDHKWGPSRIYFLDAPVKIRDVPLRKQKGFPQIPVNYGANLTIAQLIAGTALGRE